MAIFGRDVLGEAFAASIKAQSSEGKTESFLGRSMFTKNVDAVSNSGLKIFIETEEYCNKAVAAAVPTMSATSAEFAKDIAKKLATAKADFAVGFYSIGD